MGGCFAEQLRGIDAGIRTNDRAYGLYILQFIAPVFEQLTEADYKVKAGFRLSESLENWGPPEERERVVWYEIKRQDETSLGTMLLQIFHSHTRFHIPKAPRIIGIEETVREDVIRAVSSPAIRNSKGTSHQTSREVD